MFWCFSFSVPFQASLLAFAVSPTQKFTYRNDEKAEVSIAIFLAFGWAPPPGHVSIIEVVGKV